MNIIENVSSEKEKPTENHMKSFSFDKKMWYPLGREGTRILRPCEYKILYDAVPKKEYKTSLNALLLTGMRYVEMQRFQEHPQWFDGMFIHLPEEAVLKHERKQIERDIRLNPLGRTVISYFLDINLRLPSWQTWRDNLKRWSLKAGLNQSIDYPLSVKTTRKTWESWLLAVYPGRITEITLSQGHTTITSINHYLNIAFTEEDKRDMRDFVDGWI
ncbi:MAG: site-specific integrase [Candidatus Thermoplasmatota archaeon]|nr:site-specific integrase [Candidatus Thermoplasmatota archaeon]